MKNGYIALISVIIVGAIVLSIAIYMITVNLNASLSSLVIKDADQSRLLARTCSEYALLEISNNHNYSGSNNLSFLEGDCSYLVINNGGENRVINSTGESNEYLAREIVTLNQLSPKINIVSWQEVSGF